MADKTLAAANTACDAEMTGATTQGGLVAATITADPDGLSAAYVSFKANVKLACDAYKRTLDEGKGNTVEYVSADITKMTTMKSSVDTFLAAIPARPE